MYLLNQSNPKQSTNKNKLKINIFTENVKSHQSKTWQNILGANKRKNKQKQTI